MALMIKRGWYVVFLPALISLPLFLLVAMVNEYHNTNNAKRYALIELTNTAKSFSAALHYLQKNSPGITPVNYDEFVDAMASNRHSHVSIFSTDGVLLGDNMASGHALTNHPNEKKQAEIADALKNGVGQSLRKNTLLSLQMRYVAINQQAFVIRVGHNIVIEQQEVASLRYNYLPTFIILFSLTSIGGYFFIHSVNNRLKVRYQHLKQKLHTQTSELLLLQEFGTLLTLSKSLQDIEQVLAKFSQMLLYHDAGRISVIRSSRNLAEIKISWGQENWFSDKNYPLDGCWALRKGSVHPQGPYDRLIRCEHDNDEQSNIICIPLNAQGETLGVMHIRRDNLEDSFDEADRKIAISLAEQISLAVANLQLRDNLRNQAIKDSLTGLFNRRYFSETAEKELARASKNKSTMSILMLDIDFFKKLNDLHGHDGGDAVLRMFGSLLNQITQNEYIACRVGGEEFVLLLSDTSVSEASLFANTLLQKIRDMKIVNNGHNIGPISASIGIACYPLDGDDINELVKLADQALYRAKENGRDRIEFNQEMSLIEEL
ncbi:MAG: sensor domain-containing diguanylate cyclase [Psychrobium sp.]|nr:sensor domain-containing diguanylate cyclase [Psychrobium sp.]